MVARIFRKDHSRYSSRVMFSTVRIIVDAAVYGRPKRTENGMCASHRLIPGGNFSKNDFKVSCTFIGVGLARTGVFVMYRVERLLVRI